VDISKLLIKGQELVTSGFPLMNMYSSLLVCHLERRAYMRMASCGDASRRCLWPNPRRSRARHRLRRSVALSDELAGTGSRSVARALSILELIARVERPLGLAEIARELGLPKTSALSLLRALSASSFAEVDDAGRYRLGVRSFEVGAAYLRTMTPVQAVERELEWLTQELDATSHFAVLEGDEVLYLAKHDPPGTALKLASSLGARLPAAITAVGKAQLAFTTDSAPTASAEVRRLGYAIDDGNTVAGIRCVAAPVFSDRGCCGAVGVSLLMREEPPTAAVGSLVVEAAGRASTRLGGRYPRREAI
jgi:DNA-binding IclR family transcriptional regulator